MDGTNSNALLSLRRKFDRDQFQDMCRTLRVLNAVRQFEIGIPLSIQQFKVVVSSHVYFFRPCLLLPVLRPQITISVPMHLIPWHSTSSL